MSYVQGTRTYNSLVSYVEAMCSKKFNADDLVRVNTLINQAIRNLYDRYPFWSRYLVVGEPRSLSRGYVAQSEDSYNVFGSGLDDANGLYVRNGTFNSEARYTKYDDDGSPMMSIVKYMDVPTDTWAIRLGDNNDHLAYYFLESEEITDTGWFVNNVDSGASFPPSPIVDKISEIGQYLTIHPFKPDRFNCTYNKTLDFVVTSMGARLTSSSNLRIVYVTYKKKLPDKFGSGESDESNIPNEFYDYAALFTARMFNLSKQINTDPQVRNITLSEIENAAMNQLMIQEKNNPDFIQRITYTNF